MVFSNTHDKYFALVTVYAVLGIINYVFIFSSYTSFRDHFFYPWLYFVIWGVTAMIPFANVMFDILAEKFVLSIVTAVLTAMWIWGWIIIYNNWPSLWESYLPLARLLLSFQVIHFVMSYYTYSVLTAFQDEICDKHDKSTTTDEENML